MTIQPYVWLYKIVAQYVIPYALLALVIMLAVVGTAAVFVRIIGYFADKWGF